MTARLIFLESRVGKLSGAVWTYLFSYPVALIVDTGGFVAVANDKMAAVDPVRAGVVPFVPLLGTAPLASVPFAAAGKAGAVPLV